MSQNKNSNGRTSSKKNLALNFLRAGFLTIPYAGSAIEKAIFGPLDDKAKESERQQLYNALDDLKEDIQFKDANTKDQIEILARKIEDTNAALSKLIREINPNQIEAQIYQHTENTMTNIFIGMTSDDLIAFFRHTGISLPNLVYDQKPVDLGKQLLDSATQIGKLPDIIEELDALYLKPTEYAERCKPLKSDQDIINEFISASRSLLSWPTTLGEGEWIERQESELIEKIIASKETSTTLILGKPGSGKSALLSYVAANLIEKGYPVLGIKADMLRKSIENLEDLQSYLQLSYPVDVSLIQCSKNKHSVLILDQLDALCELVDRNSERLNVLLDLIHSISKINGIHVISSCRWFEYQNDVRLTTIDAEELDLVPPSWPDIDIILKKADFVIENPSEETKDLLSIPLHLKILLDLKSKDPNIEVPSSLHALLENIWQQRVLVGPNARDKIDLIKLLSNKMVEDEELWVSRVFADNYSIALQELQQEDVLKLEDSSFRIGFVHQTYFDFARARSFALGEELSEFVISRQDGLFVRPILLRTLGFLRNASPQKYSSELYTLWITENLKAHIRNLLLEYIGSIENPTEVEVSCLLPLFADDKIKYKTLLAIAGSSGWFNIIKNTKLPDMMLECAGFAHLFIPVLSRALTFAKEDVLKLIDKCWLHDQSFDESILDLISKLVDWDQQAVDIVCLIARRHESHWIPYLAEIISQNKPELAPRIVKEDFERRWELAIKQEEEYKPPPPPPQEASEAEIALYEMNTSTIKFFDSLLSQDKGWHDLSIIAETSPKAFIDNIWPWFIKVVEKIAYDPHKFVSCYQGDHSLGTYPEREIVSVDQPISALTEAIEIFSKTQPDDFIDFINKNSNSPYLAIQRLLCIGLLQIVKSHHQKVLEYLVSDPRRFVIGDYKDEHKYSKRLITAVVPELNVDQRKLLEEKVINWNRYFDEEPEWTPEDKFNRKKWNREHRLRLLRAFPKDLSSDELNKLREEEERAFPGLEDWDSKIGVGGFVGSSMSSVQMAKAGDDHIINLFEELTDDTEWRHPKRRWDLIGGSIQASREFATFVENNPERGSEIILRLNPERQERPAGMGIVGISRSAIQSDKLYEIIDELINKGFSSYEFKHEVARGLGERAQKDNGLPDHIIDLLKNWLLEDPHPSLGEEDNDEDEKIPEDSILWGYGGYISHPGGRDIYLEVIAKGYLLREPPEYQQFAEFVESRLMNEFHPIIWQITLQWMYQLFNWDINKATKYHDQVIKSCPDVIDSELGIIEYSKIVHLIPDENIVQLWLNQIRYKDSEFRKQAFGEFLMLYNFINPECQWCNELLYQVINDEQYFKEQRGVAFAASNMWHNSNHQSICTEVLINLSSTKDELIQKAISQLFLYGEDVALNKNMKRIIAAILPNDGIIIKCAERLIEGVINNTSIEPYVIHDICSRIIEVGKDEIKNPGSHYAMVAEPLVSIALTLHRMQSPHREKGLDLFERLIESDIPYARHALDILDRRPVSSNSPLYFRRRRRRKKSKSRTSPS